MEPAPNKPISSDLSASRDSQRLILDISNRPKTQQNLKKSWRKNGDEASKQQVGVGRDKRGDNSQDEEFHVKALSKAIANPALSTTKTHSLKRASSFEHVQSAEDNTKADAMPHKRRRYQRRNSFVIHETSKHRRSTSHLHTQSSPEFLKQRTRFFAPNPEERGSSSGFAPANQAVAGEDGPIWGHASWSNRSDTSWYSQLSSLTFETPYPSLAQSSSTSIAAGAGSRTDIGEGPPCSSLSPDDDEAPSGLLPDTAINNKNNKDMKLSPVAQQAIENDDDRLVRRLNLE